MTSVFFQIGDEVVLEKFYSLKERSTDQESYWLSQSRFMRTGYSDAGKYELSKFIVVGFEEIYYGRNSEEVVGMDIKPGVYVNRDRVKIKLANVPEVEKADCSDGSMGVTLIKNAYELVLADKEIKKKRLNDARIMRKKFSSEKKFEAFFRSKDFIRDLPKTFFWEEDRVILRDPFLRFWVGDKEKVIFLVEPLKIKKIAYSRLSEEIVVDQDGETVKFHAYSIKSEKEGIELDVREEDIKLVERGSIWKAARRGDKATLNSRDLYLQSCSSTTFHLV